MYQISNTLVVANFSGWFWLKGKSCKSLMPLYLQNLWF